MEENCNIQEAYASNMSEEIQDAVEMHVAVKEDIQDKVSEFSEDSIIVDFTEVVI